MVNAILSEALHTVKRFDEKSAVIYHVILNQHDFPFHVVVNSKSCLTILLIGIVHPKIKNKNSNSSASKSIWFRGGLETKIWRSQAMFPSPYFYAHFWYAHKKWLMEMARFTSVLKMHITE